MPAVPANATDPIALDPFTNVIVPVGAAAAPFTDTVTLRARLCPIMTGVG